MRIPLPCLALVLLAAVGCQNPCQDLCQEMADYADKCGYTWDETAVQQCVEDQASVTAEEKDLCAEYEGQVESWWECEDIMDYFDNPGHTSGK